MPYRRTVAPAIEPVSVDEAKFQARVDGSVEDGLIQAYIETARDYCEKVQNRAYIEQTWEMVLDSAPGRIITLPQPPLMSVSSIIFTDAEGVQTTVDAGDYLVDVVSQPGRVLLKDGKDWPDIVYPVTGGVKITFKAGYGATAADVPRAVKQAILLLVADWYKNRENTMQSDRQLLLTVPVSVDRLLQLDRCIPV